MNDAALLIGIVILTVFVLAVVWGYRRNKKISKPVLEKNKKTTQNKTNPPEPTLEPEAQPNAIPEKVITKVEKIAAKKADKISVTPVTTNKDDLSADKTQQNDTIALVKAVDAEPISSRFKVGLQRTRSNFTEGLNSLLLGKKTIDEDLLEEIEEQLLVADIGVDAVSYIVDNLTKQLERKQLKNSQALYQALKEELRALVRPCVQPMDIKDNKPYVILMVGVNGAGKTTTIGKLAKRLQSEGRSVMLAAGDTFRAAAVEQLQEWGARNEVPVIAQNTGSDSASVIFDAIDSARARGIDVLIADTAGRLQNKDHLMAELSKVKRVMAKLDNSAPHEVMLVLDAGTGQNALSQAKLFNDVVGITGITLTKLDGTAKGGVIFAIAKRMQLPIRFIGIGEKIDDLRPFNADEFVDALFDQP